MLRPSTNDDAVCVNAAVEINVLDYNVAVRRRTSTYGDVRRRIQCEQDFTLCIQNDTKTEYVGGSCLHLKEICLKVVISICNLKFIIIVVCIVICVHHVFRFLKTST